MGENVWVECMKAYVGEEIYNADETGIFYLSSDTIFESDGDK
jgi:hypothetical protein